MNVRRVVEAHVGSIHDHIVTHELTVAIGIDSPDPFEKVGLFDPVSKKGTDFGADGIAVVENSD